MAPSARAPRPPADGPPTEQGGIRAPRSTVDPDAAGISSASGPLTEPASPASQEVPEFLRGWRRYRVLSRLGSGGMGEVYRAWDPQLQRWVALKFLHGSDPLQLARFQREAQAQARVDHPGVCRVYEVGEVERRPYIAMQEIAGANLDLTARELPLEERVRLVAQVAEAVHAAHRIGLIHRDLKPGNILVAWGEDGFHPFVVDFGLARDQHLTGATWNGSLSGTPGYMAPEQATGDDATLDRRADVYSLGAVLYQLITGQVPLPASNLAEAVVMLLHEEPVPLRQLAPSVPADLETVVMKCLDKNPSRRYDSASALAADLRRWLDGEPVEARRAGVLYRLGKRAARHPRVAVASALAVLLIAGLAGVVLRTRWEASARAEAARRFGTAAKEMESLLRVGELAPPHDTRAERAAVRATMRRVEREMASLGRGGRGGGLYALGRGALALGQASEALRHLQAAWREGERGPEVSYALGQALGERYFEELQRLSAVSKAVADAPLRRDLERRFRDPARAQLRRAMASPGGLDAPELVEALLALHEGRYDVAHAAAERAMAGRPWLYEARLLQGLAWRRQGEEETDSGRLDEALASLARAGEANAMATAIARSGAQVQAEECSRQWALVRVLRLRRPLVDGDAAAAVSPCERARAFDPWVTRAWGDEARIWTLFAQDQTRRGVDPLPAVGRARTALARQIEIDPRADDAWAALGDVHEVEAGWQSERGTDPRPQLARAEEAYRAAIRLEPRRASTYNELGNVMILEWRYAAAHGLPTEPLIRRAIAAFERAVELWDGFASAHANLGQAWTNVGVADLAAGRDPRPALQRSIAGYRRGVALNPSYPAYHNNQGNAHLALGEYLLALGEDPRAALGDAVAAYQAALALRPEYALPLLNLAYTRRLLATWQLRSGEDPTATLRLAGVSLEEALRLAPGDADNELERGREALIAARWEITKGRTPLAALEHAGRALAAGVVSNPGNAELRVAQAERWRWTAEWQQRSAREAAAARTAIVRGLAAVDEALALHPGMAEALATRSALLRLRGDAAGAAAALSAARRANPLVAAE